ncbi:MAG TPA: Flp family type IVb pilin [Alphaproteobacteria bacterium]|nr:Flp family type IVb pilin [Alphaproteobacteria bacterium]
MKKILAFLSCQGGATAIEYALIATGISLAIAVSVFAFGDDIYNLFYSDMADALAGE